MGSELFEDALDELVDKHLENEGAEAVISALELKLQALRDNDANEPGDLEE